MSKVPISVTALTQDAMDVRGIKDILDVARFTPGINIDNSGTNNIAIRGIASTGGAGTTGIYLDDTPIQMRALAFNPDEALPQSFDLERVEVLRGPQGTLFGAGSEGGTVRYITTPASLTADQHLQPRRGFLHAGRATELRGRRRRRHPHHRRHPGGARDRLVPLRRRVDRPHQPGHVRHRAKECELCANQGVSALGGVGSVRQFESDAELLLSGSIYERRPELLAAVLDPRAAIDT